MISDGELLRRYAEARSEEAFAELVRRHVALVYSAALRQVNGDQCLAQDVAQNVFADLARKASSLTDRPVLSGWLYTSAHFAASKAVRTERRRQEREQEAHIMKELAHESGPELDWEPLRPVLDTAMHDLDEADREVILMRYFEKRKHSEIGERIGLSENAARMKVERALERLRGALSRRGLTTTATLAAVISAHGVGAVPAGLAAAITTGVVSGMTAGTVTATAGAAAAKAITLTTLQKIVAGAILTALVGTGVYEARKVSVFKRELEASQKQQAPLSKQVSDLTAENDRLSNLVALTQGTGANPLSSTSGTQHGRSARSGSGLSELEARLREAVKLADGARQKRLEEIGRSVAATDIPDAMRLAESVLSLTADRRLFQATLMLAWAETDPGGALDFGLAFAEGKVTAAERQQFATVVLRGWAAKDAAAALAWVDKQAAGPQRLGYYAAVLTVMAESDPERALAKLKEMPPGRERTMIIQQIAVDLGSKDPAAAAKVGTALPAGNSRDTFLQQLAGVWIGKDPKAALQFILDMPASGSRDELMRSAVAAWARTDGPAAAKFSETLQFNRMWSMTGVGYNWAINDPAAAWQWSLTIADDETRRSSLGGVLRSLATHSRLDDAAGYAAQLAGDDQVRAVRSLLIDSSDLDPDWTARWVATFPAGETRNQAVEKLVQHWSETDPFATANWLAEQPQDAAFQAGARRLIPGMTKASPATAWDWAMVLTDQPVRQERLELVAKTWLVSDPDAAREKIAGSGLPAEQVSKLLGQAR